MACKEWKKESIDQQAYVITIVSKHVCSIVLIVKCGIGIANMTLTLKPPPPYPSTSLVMFSDSLAGSQIPGCQIGKNAWLRVCLAVSSSFPLWSALLEPYMQLTLTV